MHIPLTPLYADYDGTFNTLLEMPFIYQLYRRLAKIRAFNTLLEMLVLPLRMSSMYDYTCFQYSIRDASKYLLLDDGSLVRIRFQYSIRDA